MMAMIVTPVVIMPMSMPAPMIVVFTLIMAPALVLTPVSRRVIVVIPVISHEIDAPTASPVFGTMPSPVTLITRRNTQIDRCLSIFRSLPDNDRLLIDHLWRWITADVELSIETRLAHADGHTHLSECGNGDRCEHYCE